MDTETTDPDLLLLSLSLSDSEPEEAAPAHDTTASSTGAQTNNTPAGERQPTRAERTALSEEAFQALKQSYIPKIENGNICKAITTPILSSSSKDETLSKPEAQELLHAAEELYFFRRYAEAAAFLGRALHHDDGDGEADGSSRSSSMRRRIDGETRQLLEYYEARCLERLKEGQGEE